MINKVLITGAAGFLGSHLCDYFIARGDKVTGMDNMSTGSLKNLSHLKKNKKFTFYSHDIIEDLPLGIMNDKYDIILNMASPASPPHYQRLGIETLRVGSIGTQYA
jgi:dTDP-glucose 4,6-dehydratase